jgi:penicillin-binding protein 1B
MLSTRRGLGITDAVLSGMRRNGKKSPRRIWRISTALLLIGFVFALAVAGASSWHYSLPEPGTSQPAVRLYAGAEPVGVIYPTHKAQSWVPIDRIPRPVVDAVLIAEDRRFWTHPGVDPLAVARALHVNLSRNELRQGASTITQQVARTVFLDTRRTWGRKLRETGIAILLELRYSKARILETYLNTVYLGQEGEIPVYGLPAAARHFLGKDLDAIEIHEAAWLAGAIRAPNRLLAGSRAEARRRRDEILVAMQEQRLIDPAAARQALAHPLPRQSPDSARVAPYFVDFVAAELARRAVLPDSGEIRMQTTLNLALQRAAETAVRNGISRIEKTRPSLAGQVQAAVLAIDPASGEIRVLVGGRRYAESSFNRATRAARQPGSIFKPFVYLAAFEAERRGTGLTPASILSDEPLSVRAGADNWEPRNMDGRFHGPVTVRRALEQSLNIPAVRVTLDLGAHRVADVARAVGIDHPLSPVPSLALGTSEVTLLEITSAFATLANGGVRMAPTALAADFSASALPLAPLPAASRAVSAESAFMITHLLRGVMRRGTGAGSAAWGLQDLTAGKTGTTDALRDAWFVGYTPDLVVGVWVGLDDGTPLGLTGAQAALPIWGPVMQAAVRQTAPGSFTPPPGVVMTGVDRATGRRVSFWCGSDDVVQEAFREGSQLSEGCDTTVQNVGTALLGWFEKLFK